jgi:hypothetical protein
MVKINGEFQLKVHICAGIPVVSTVGRYLHYCKKNISTTKGVSPSSISELRFNSNGILREYNSTKAEFRKSYLPELKITRQGKSGFSRRIEC